MNQERRVLELARTGDEESLVDGAERVVVDDTDADELLERIFAADVVLVV